ncbi:myb-like protein H [Aplysia californica]|uniref:Myb-like protein H n=2 Tax=Aplysia californica TaxID=6500 RepID=A0ABM0ZYZ5_APLCA|nr:myb-like protein H [Aplysia californica]
MSSIPQRKRARPKPPATGPGKNDNINNNSNNSNNKYNTHDSKYNTHDSNPVTSPSGDSRNTDVTDEDVGVGSQVNSAQSSKVSYEESSAVEPSAKTSSKNSGRGGGGGECSEEDYSSPKPNGATGRGGPYDQSAPRKSGGLKKVSSQPVINHFSPSASASAASADENVTGSDGDLTLSKRQNKPSRPKTSKLTSRKDVSKSLNLDSSSPQNSNGAVKKQNGNSSSRSSSNGSSSGGSSNNNSNNNNNNNNNNVSRLSLPSDGLAASPRELSDGSEVGDKKVSFRDERLESYADDLPAEAPPTSGDPNMAVHSDRQNALEPLQTERWENVNVHVHEPPNTERRDRQNALEPSPTERGSVTSRERVNSFGKKRDVSNASLDKLSAISREQPLVNRWTDSPRSGDASGPWRKVSNENSLIKSARETRDADLANEGAPPDRYGSPRDDFDFDPSGRKFTKKVGKHNFGSSTTLSSNTDNSEDNDDNFNVVLRVRPLNPQEKSRRDKFVADFPGDGQVVANNSGTTRSFQFNVVFEPDAAQEDVFENSGLKKLVENALNGYTCTAFAFGQTGSGKTHTMTGPPAQFHTEGVTPDPNMYGIIQRSFKHLFQLLKRQGTTKMIRASYLEIYNEQVIDLLNNSHRRYLQVRWSKNKGFYVENLFTVECESIDDLMAVLEEGEW